MNREILVHIRVHIMLSNDLDFKERLESAYEEFKNNRIKDEKLYNQIYRKEFSFYELTYFDKIKNLKYKEMIEMESSIMLASIENVLIKRRKKCVYSVK